MVKVIDGIEYVPMSELKKLEHIIEGLNAQLLAESEEIHDLEEEIHNLEEKR